MTLSAPPLLLAAAGFAPRHLSARIPDHWTAARWGGDTPFGGHQVRDARHANRAAGVFGRGCGRGRGDSCAWMGLLPVSRASPSLLLLGVAGISSGSVTRLAAPPAPLVAGRGCDWWPPVRGGLAARGGSREQVRAAAVGVPSGRGSWAPPPAMALVARTSPRP